MELRNRLDEAKYEDSQSDCTYLKKVEIFQAEEKAEYHEKWVRRAASRAVLFYWDCRTPFKWGCERSLLIGISSLFYLHPMTCLRPYLFWESNMWLLVTICSFLSDYVFSGQRGSSLIRGVHLVDRWVASLALSTQIIYNVPLWFSESFALGLSGFVIVSAAVLTKVAGFFAKDFQQYIFLHFAWHTVGAFGRSIQNSLQYERFLSV